MRSVCVYALAILLVLFSDRTEGLSLPEEVSLRGASRFEYWREKEVDENSVGERLEVDVDRGSVSAGVRVEFSRKVMGQEEGWRVAQRHLAFRGRRVDLRAGNYYETFGRGLVLRAFEEQAVQLGRSERSLRVDRNLSGVTGKASVGKVTIKGLRGRPLDEYGDREDEPLWGGDLEVELPHGAGIGVSGVRITPSYGWRTSVWSGRVSLSRARSDLYLEYARKEVPSDAFEEDGRGLYAAGGVLLGDLSVSAEYKDYDRFVFPHNDPPAVAKSHAFTLLNRHTHTADADDERGIHVEVSHPLGSDMTLSGSYSRATSRAEMMGEAVLDFDEMYAEMRRFGERVSATLIVDRMKSLQFGNGDRSRITLISGLDAFLPGGNTLYMEWERQWVDSTFMGGEYWNQLFLLEWAWSRFSLGVQREWSREPEVDRSTWNSFYLNLRFLGTHQLNVFYGFRPAGLVCTGGTCAFLPEFEGVEIRLLDLF